jgi:hypothetical protein
VIGRFALAAGVEPLGVGDLVDEAALVEDVRRKSDLNLAICATPSWFLRLRGGRLLTMRAAETRRPMRTSS